MASNRLICFKGVGSAMASDMRLANFSAKVSSDFLSTGSPDAMSPTLNSSL